MCQNLGQAIFLALSWTGFFFLGAMIHSANQQGTIPTVTVQQATLDEALIIKRVVDMRDGDTAFLTSDSMLVDDQRRCWLNPYAIVTPEDTRFKIWRKNDGFHLELKEKSVRWAKAPLDVIIPEQKVRDNLIPVRSLKIDIPK